MDALRVFEKKNLLISGPPRLKILRSSLLGMHGTGLEQLKGSTKKAQETKGRYVLFKQLVMQQES